MVFEGSEKIIELGVQPNSPSLRHLPYTFWQTLVAEAGAEIISVVKNEACDAYLLSESSLFVWDGRIRMLTCGATQLSNALVLFIKRLGTESIAYGTYQRKNEYLLQPQIRSFEQDLAYIAQTIAGKGYRMGHLNNHHHYLFSTNAINSSDLSLTATKPTIITKPLATTELLMYHLRGSLAEYFRSPNQTAKGIRDALALSCLFSDFELDDHLFSPCGYSLNGIKEDRYFTLHITPQAQSSYCSFETNLTDKELPPELIEHFLLKLQPERWDLICVNRPLPVAKSQNNSGINSYSITTEGGYDIHFKHVVQ
ncbi:MAG: adenosylmethionine decarboxylase [Shewanella sp.]